MSKQKVKKYIADTVKAVVVSRVKSRSDRCRSRERSWDEVDEERAERRYPVWPVEYCKEGEEKSRGRIKMIDPRMCREEEGDERRAINRKGITFCLREGLRVGMYGAIRYCCTVWYYTVIM